MAKCFKNWVLDHSGVWKQPTTHNSPHNWESLFSVRSFLKVDTHCKTIPNEKKKWVEIQDGGGVSRNYSNLLPGPIGITTKF